MLRNHLLRNRPLRNGLFRNQRYDRAMNISNYCNNCQKFEDFSYFFSPSVQSSTYNQNRNWKHHS